jgi:hypothetical protein
MSTTIELTGVDGTVVQWGQFPNYQLAEEVKKEWLRHKPNRAAVLRAEVVPVPGTGHGPEEGHADAVVWQCSLEVDPFTRTRTLTLNGQEYILHATGRDSFELEKQGGELYEVSWNGIWRCDCPDYGYRRQKTKSLCKHLTACVWLGLIR